MSQNFDLPIYHPPLVGISIWIWIADVMSFQKMYGLSGPWGPTAVLPLIYELRPNPPHKSNKNNKIFPSSG